MEQIIPVSTQTAPEPTSGDPFHGQVADELERAISASLAGHGIQPVANPPPAPPPTPPATPAAPPYPTPQAIPPSPPPVPSEQQVPVLSTAPVGDVTSMFLDGQTPSPTVSSALPQLLPDAPIEQPEGMTEKANNSWKYLKERLRNARQVAEAAQQELARVTKQAGEVASERVRFSEEIKNRDDRIRRLEEDLGRLDLAHKPEFHQQYDKPMEAIREQMRSALADSTSLTDAKELNDTTTRLLEATDQDFNRIVSKLPSPAQSSLWDKRREYLGLMADREQALSDWRETQRGVEVQDDQNKLVERSQHRRELAEGAIDYVKNIVPPDKRVPVLSEATYADDIANVDQQFRGFMQTAKEGEMARMTYQGFLVPVMQRQLAFMAEAMNQWRDAYYRLRGAGAPPSMPMRVASEPAPVAQPAAPQIVEGANFQGTIQNTVEDTLRRAGLV